MAPPSAAALAVVAVLAISPESPPPSAPFDAGGGAIDVAAAGRALDHAALSLDGPAARRAAGRDRVARAGGLQGSPPAVRLDPDSLVGDGRLDAEQLEVESCAPFLSVRCRVGVRGSGRWGYEVLLATAGVMQLGWAADDCAFSAGEGVGDARNSYAFDGARCRKWSDGSTPYGEAWSPGDVIGCYLDLDLGAVGFSRNGVYLGMAAVFSGERWKRRTYYPAASLARRERVEFNFGDRPFFYELDSATPGRQYIPLIPTFLSPPAHTAHTAQPAHTVDGDDAAATEAVAAAARAAAPARLAYLCSALARLVTSPAITTADVAALAARVCENLEGCLAAATEPEAAAAALGALLSLTPESRTPESGTPESGTTESPVRRFVDCLLGGLSRPEAAGVLSATLAELSRRCRHCNANLGLTVGMPWPGPSAAPGGESSRGGDILTGDPGLAAARAAGHTPLDRASARVGAWAVQGGVALVPPGAAEAYLALAVALISIPGVVSAAAEGPAAAAGLWKSLEGFFACKPPSASDLAEELPGLPGVAGVNSGVNWTSYSSLGHAWRDGARRTARAVAACQRLQASLMAALAPPPRLGPSLSSPPPPSPLLEFARHLSSRNRGAALRLVPPPGLSEPSVLPALVLTLLRFLGPHLSGGPGSKLTSIPAAAVIAPAATDAPRLGGTLHFLESAAAAASESESAAVAGAPPPPQWPPTAPVVLPAPVPTPETPLSPEDAVALACLGDWSPEQLLEATDAVCLLLLPRLSDSFHRFAALEQARCELAWGVATSLTAGADGGPWTSGETADAHRSALRFRLVVGAPWQRRGVAALASFLGRLALALCPRPGISDSTPNDSRPGVSGPRLVAYLPEHHAAALAQCYHVLRRDPGTPGVPESGTRVRDSGELTQPLAAVVALWVSGAVLSPELRETLLHTVSVSLALPASAAGLAASHPGLVADVASTLLSPGSFSPRFWLPTCALLARVFAGTGVGERVEGGGDASGLGPYRAAVAATLARDASLCAAVLESVITHVNWAAGELGVALAEALAWEGGHASPNAESRVSSRGGGAGAAEAAARRVLALAYLAAVTLRLLEGVVSSSGPGPLAAHAVTARIAEAVTFVLSRAVGGTQGKRLEPALAAAARLAPPALRPSFFRLARAQVLAPAGGVLLAAWGAENARGDGAVRPPKGQLATALAGQAGGDAPESDVAAWVDAVARLDWASAFPAADGRGLESVASGLAALARDVGKVATVAATVAASESETPDCAICCAAPAAAVLVPCGHRCCRRCIERHLAEKTTCFFCAATVERITG